MSFIKRVPHFMRVLDLPHHGTLNVHPSLLPLLRGPSPVRTAIREDLRDAVGVSIIKLDAEVDHGPLVAQARVELPEWPVVGRVLDELLFREGGRLLAEVIPLWMKGEIPPEEQDHSKATFTKKFAREDGELSLTDDGYANYLKYCAMDGWPGTYFFVDKQGVRIRVKINTAVYENGAFIVRTVTPEGKKEMPYEVFLKS
jgi:methionyl-tRNA formyltransferase